MANLYTSTASTSLGGTVGAAGLVQKAYDRLLEFALRSEPLLRSVADKRPARQAIPGSTVVLQRYVDLDTKTSTLTGTTDPDAVALTTPTSVTITLNEYGNAVLVTRALELFSLADVDPAIANIIAYNLADSIDQVVSTTLTGGTNVIYSGSTATSGADKVAAALRIILGDANVKVVLINIFGGITRCDEVARGILTAKEEVKPKVPMVIRLVGTNAEEGRRILDNAKMITAETLADAAKKAVAAASGI